MHVIETGPPATLTREQEAIASAPPEARLLVTAGAGTGKTHVLIERLHRFTEEYDLSLSDDVLVVSFSRAAVGEIRRRMRERGGRVAYGAVTTFDSFASQLLFRHRPPEALGGMNFDDRIRAASTLIAESDEARDDLRRIRHVIVDEVQDLVGVRRLLVQSILEHATGGFTLFGDPAQGIYNFQAEEQAERQLGSLLFFNWVKNELPGRSVKELSLTKNFRYQTEEAKSAEWAGPLLNGSNPDYGEILERLEDGLFDLPAVGTVGELVDELRAKRRRTVDEGTVGVLCYFNFEVLRVSAKLAAAGIEHHYQRPAADRTVPAWVGRLLRGCESTRLGQSAFEERAASVDTAPDDAWRLLKRFDPGGNRDSIDLLKLQERIRIGDIPAELAQPTRERVVVSTIHRAKGLEFDRVLLFEPEGESTGDEMELGERARQLYVARTRARRAYGVLTRPKREYAKREGNPGDVWTMFGYAGSRRYVTEVEVKGTHSWAQDPAGAFAFEGDAAELQRYIETEVRQHDPLQLRRTSVQMPDGPRWYYVIEHDGRDVGVADIGWILKILLRPTYDRNWPTRLDGLLVDSVDTVAGTSAAGARAGLGSSGIWLRVRPYGLGRLHWDKDE